MQSPLTIEHVRRYGVKEQVTGHSDVDRAVEQIRLLGYAVLEGGYTQSELEEFSAAFDAAQERSQAEYGRDALVEIDEHNTIRALLLTDPLFVKLATNPKIRGMCDQLLGEYSILNQQNGIANPPHGERYNQGSFHRDLPYQHFVSSRPLAINALFCLDPFTVENGATLAIPASHKQEAFPSDEAVRRHAIAVTAPRGSFIVLDCMLFHSGGVNRTAARRRGVNHVYTIPLLRQQIDLPSALAGRYRDDPELARFLGYQVDVPRSVADYYATRRASLPQRN